MNKDTIVNKHFQRSFPGYDVEEVDAFLDEIVRDMDRREQELGILKLRIKILLEELEGRGLINRKAGTTTKTVPEQQKPTGGRAESDTQTAQPVPPDPAAEKETSEPDEQ